MLNFLTSVPRPVYLRCCTPSVSSKEMYEVFRTVDERIETKYQQKHPKISGYYETLFSYFIGPRVDHESSRVSVFYVIKDNYTPL